MSVRSSHNDFLFQHGWFLYWRSIGAPCWEAQHMFTWIELACVSSLSPEAQLKQCGGIDRSIKGDVSSAKRSECLKCLTTHKLGRDGRVIIFTVHQSKIGFHKPNWFFFPFLCHLELLQWAGVLLLLFYCLLLTCTTPIDTTLGIWQNRVCMNVLVCCFNYLMWGLCSNTCG